MFSREASAFFTSAETGDVFLSAVKIDFDSCDFSFCSTLLS